MMVMIQEHAYVFHGDEAIGDTIVRPDLGGWASPEQALAEVFDANDGIERKPYRNGWEERSPAIGGEYAELGITTLITRIWFETRDVDVDALAEVR